MDTPKELLYGMHTPGDSAMLCRFTHVQSVTFFAHAVVCTVILRRGRGSATFGPGRSRHTLRHQRGGCRRARVHSRVTEGGGRAWPGFEIDYSEPQARVWRSRGRPPPSGTKTGSPGPEGTANPDGERAADPTAPGVPVTQPRPRRCKTRARHSTEYRARRRL